MTKITNKDLLRNCRPGRVFITSPSDHLSLIYLVSGKIGPLGGKVGAVIMDGEYFITSSNQTCIYTPPLGDQHQVRLCADSRYGDDDPVLWPQPYMPYHSHFGAIP